MPRSVRDKVKLAMRSVVRGLWHHVHWVAVSIAIVAIAGAKLAAASASVPVATPIAISEAAEVSVATAISAPEEGAFIGVFKPRMPFDMSAHDDYVAAAGKAPAIIMWFQPWDPKGASEFDTAAVFSVYEKGAIPLITWEPWTPGGSADPADQPQYGLETVIRGDHDEYLRGWARAIRQLGGPVMLRPMHEMNGYWYPWGGTVNGNTPEQFVNAWRHVHGIFEEEGATNVTWVWSINWGSLPNNPENEYSVYYPGDQYVDWASISGFNWGTSVREDAPWKSFDDIYTKALKYLATVDKPIVLSEFGCASAGGDKAQWIRDTYAQIRTEHPEIKAIVYYDHDEQRQNDFQDWSIDSAPGSGRAYFDAVEDSHYLGAPVSAVDEWMQESDPLLLGRLKATPRIY